MITGKRFYFEENTFDNYKNFFINFRASWEEPVKMELNEGNILYSAPPPGSGILLALILNILKGYRFSKEDISSIKDTIMTYHRIVEAFKYTFAKRTELGDPEFVDIEDVKFIVRFLISNQKINF